MPSLESVEASLATHTATTQALLQDIRATIRAAVPGLQECISKQIPTYKLDGFGTGVVHFAGCEKHASRVSRERARP